MEDEQSIDDTIASAACPLVGKPMLSLFFIKGRGKGRQDLYGEIMLLIISAIFCYTNLGGGVGKGRMVSIQNKIKNLFQSMNSVNG